MQSALGTESFQVRAQEHSAVGQSKCFHSEKAVHLRLKTVPTTTVPSDIQPAWAQLALGVTVTGDVRKAEHPNKKGLCRRCQYASHYSQEVTNLLFLKTKGEVTTKENLKIWRKDIQLICFTKRNRSSCSGLSTEALKQLSKVSPYARRHSASPGSSMTPPWVVLKLSTNTTTFPSLRPSGLNADIQCRCFSPSSTFLYSPKVLSPTHECPQRRSPRDQLFF